MERTPDEIKKGLEALKFVANAGRIDDALALIQQLESDKQQLEGMLAHMNQLRDAAAGRALKMEKRAHQLEAERDAAVTDIDEMVMQTGFIACDWCDHCGCESDCSWSSSNPGFKWRGVQKEE